LTATSKEIYKAYFEKPNELPLFYQPWWLDLLCGDKDWNVAMTFDKGGKPTAILPYCKRRFKGFNLLSNPPFSPYLGIRFFYPENLENRSSRYSFENKVMEQLIQQLPRDVFYMDLNFHPDFDNWYPFYFNGFKQSIRYTYILDNISDQEKIYSAFSQTLKRQLKQAEKNVTISSSQDSKALYEALSQSLQKQKIKVPVSSKQLQEITGALEERQLGEILIAKDHQDKILASMLLAWDQNQAYCLLLGMNDDRKQNNAVKLLLSNSIKRAAERVDNYNFEGSMIRNVERVFRSFGGKRTAYYRIFWYKNRWIRTLFAFFNK
jgi:hypothetical protein